MFQEETAALLGVSRIYVGMLERGKKLPSLSLAAVMEEKGIASASDWMRPARCEACDTRLTSEAPEADDPPIADACPVRGAGCPYAAWIAARVREAA